ncbi:TolC family protein [Pedobacter sp. UYP1]|uniref:TolC family protein n=1 Tax=Pedobacter sp. UYP1 TaxID=1756396 RepID=UPI0033949E38
MKTINQIIFILLILIIGAESSKAQTEVLPLDSVLVRLGLNPGLQAYDAKIGAQNAYAKGAKSLPAPQISAGQYQTPYSLTPNTGSFMISAEQMFTNPAKLRAKQDYMNGMSKVTAEDKNYMKNQLAAQAKGYYYNMGIIERKRTLLASTKGLLEYMLKSANIRLTYGKEKLNNIYKAKADLYELDNGQEQFNNDLKQQRILLNILMSRDKQIDFSVDTTLMVKDYETSVTDTAMLVAVRSDIKGINQNINLQALNAKMEYSKRKPDFGLQAAHMFSYGGMANQYILMGSVTIPVFSWSSKEYKANLKGISYEVEELKQKKLDLINQVEGNLAGLRSAIKSKKILLKNYNQNIIPALQNNYKTSLLAYEQNTGEMQVVLEGLKALKMARMEALDRLGELLQLQVNYERENEKY